MKKKVSKDGNVVELISNGKRLTMSKDEEGLSLDLSMVSPGANNLYNESFEIGKKDRMYKAFDGVFRTFPLNSDGFKGLLFDTLGANVILSKQEEGYSLLFVKEFYEGSSELRAKLIGNSTENKSMNKMFEVLAKKRKMMNYSLPLKKANFSRIKEHRCRFGRNIAPVQL